MAEEEITIEKPMTAERRPVNDSFGFYAFATDSIELACNGIIQKQIKLDRNATVKIYIGYN